MNNRQKLQLFLAAIGVVLIIFWLTTVEGGTGRVLGILSNALLIFAVLLAFREEKKRKKDKKD